MEKKKIKKKKNNEKKKKNIIHKAPGTTPSAKRKLQNKPPSPWKKGMVPFIVPMMVGIKLITIPATTISSAVIGQGIQYLNGLFFFPTINLVVRIPPLNKMKIK